MQNCKNCKKSFHDNDLKEFYTKLLCEDCYIDEVVPKMPKAYYGNNFEFMNRLKDSYIAHAQQFH